MKTRNQRSCIICRAALHGRSDKKFCSIGCKNEYHLRLRRSTARMVKETDRILHRNRSILLELMGNNLWQKKVTVQELNRKKFNWKVMTGYYINSRNKTFHLVYDFAWVEFRDGGVLIQRRQAQH